MDDNQNNTDDINFNTEMTDNSNINQARNEKEANEDRKQPELPPNATINDTQNNFQLMKINLMNFLKSIEEWSNSNDPEAIQYLSERIPIQIHNFLASNMITYNIEMLKLFFMFFVSYLQIRINYLETMSNNELSCILKIVDSCFPYYMNINNNNNISEESFDYLMREIFYPLGFQSGPIINQNFKVNQSINLFYKYMLTYLLHTNYFQKLIQFLNSPPILMEFDKFYYVYVNLLRIIQNYENFDSNIINDLMKAVVEYYDKFIENQQVKEMSKTALETFFKNNAYNDFVFLILIGDTNIEENKIYTELIIKDLRIIHYLLLYQNLEKRVIGMKGLTELINHIIIYEKADDKLIKSNNNYKVLHYMINLKKKILLEWLDKISIFQIIFGENIHEAILKKSSAVLIFLYINDKLSFDQIDFIWKIAGDKHEAVSASILNLFSDLISYFSIDHAMYILKIINEMPYKEVNDVTIKILDSFSNNKYLTAPQINKDSKTAQAENMGFSNIENNLININNDDINLINIKNEGNLEFLLNQLNNDTKDINDFKSFYLKIIWKFSSENSYYAGLTSQIITKARKVFSSILLKPVFKYELCKYIKKCILGINFNHMLTTNLCILDLIFKNMKNLNSDLSAEIFNAFGNEIKDMKTFLDYLEKQYSLTSIILHAILNVKKEVLVISGEIINLQTNMLAEKDEISDKERMITINDIMTNYDIKFSEQNEKINNIKCITEEVANKEISSMIPDMDFEIQNLNNNNNISSEQEIHIASNNNAGNNNLDETLSTEKSLDNSISTISTDISPIEKSRIYMVKEFIENNISYYQAKNKNNLDVHSVPLFQDNYEIIFKKLKLSFSNANYYSIIASLIEFYKYLIFSSNIQITQSQIEYLFTLLVDNSVDEEEENLFYLFFSEIFRYQFITKQNYISEENLNFILFDIILKIQISSLPYSSFILFKQIFYFINTYHNNLTVASQKIVDVKDFSQLIGFETLWKFYIESKNLNISNDSQNILVNLIAVMAKKDDNKDSFIFIFEKVFDNLNYYYNCLREFKDGLNNQKNNNFEFEERTNKLINLLFIVNSTKQKFDKPKSENLSLNIQNFYYSGSDGKKNIINVSSDNTVKELKSIIINKVILPVNDDNNLNSYKPLIDDSSLMLLSKGKIIKNDKLTIRDLKFQNGVCIQVYKSDGNYTEMEVSDERLFELIYNIKSIFEGLEDEVIKRALKKNSYSCDDTVVYLFDETNILAIKNEIQEENSIAIQDVQSKFNFELFNEEKINLLIAMLDLEIISLNKNIWQLISAIKLPNSVISILVEPGQINFNRFMEIDKPNKFLLYLRIINCLIFNDKYFMNLKLLDENKRNEWKMNFLVTEGLTCMVNSINIMVDSLNSLIPDQNYCKMSCYIQCLQIASKWMHFFSFSTAISLSPNKDNLSSTIKQIISRRPHGIQFGIPSNIPNTPAAETPKNSSHATPTFGSPHSSFSGSDDKNKKIPKSFSIIGAEEYDNTYEEEVSNSYYFKLIEANFHSIILNYLSFASNPYNIVYFNFDNEAITLNFFEILIIINEINPMSFKEFINIELEKSIVMNFLFVEKSKFVRKIVENLFNILLTQYKSFDITYLNLSLHKNGVKSLKDLLMLHILNNYKRIYSGQVYEEFFNLFGTMLLQKNETKDTNDDNIFGDDFNVNNLTRHILSIIFNLSQKNDLELTEIEQEQLSGNMHLFQCLCASNDQVILNCLENFNNENNINLIKFLYGNLFTMDDRYNLETNKFENVQFKYSNKNLRQKAYNLLLSLMRLKDSFKKELGMSLVTHHSSFRNDTINNIDIDIGIKSKNDKFIGLRNYGCTCYLNSLIQQLFMIPSYRAAIHSVPILENKEKFQDLDKNPLFQLQLLFANLSYSLKQFHTPLHFIKSFTDAFNNQPINVAVQQDCEEFLNILNDKLEIIAKQVNMEHIFDNSIRGTISYETISIEKEFPYYSESENSCIAISLDIKNKRNIEDALDLFIKGEILEGENKFYCEKYDKKISIIRRCSIKRLPPNVFIHLKRFEFDYNTFEKIKLNDYCEFPNLIDFKAWTRAAILMQNKDDPCYKDIIIDEEEMSLLNDADAFRYKLTGVLVHSGATAESGHYFSFIYDIESDKWHKYDDSKISEFNINDLKTECFGEDKENVDIFSKTQNAYLLVYTKVSINKTKNPLVLTNVEIPSNILVHIKNENMLFLKYKNYLDNDYFMFIREFLDFSILKHKSIDKLNKKEKSMSRRDLMNEEIHSNLIESINKSNLNLIKPEDMEKIKLIYFSIKDKVENNHKKTKFLPQSTNLNTNIGLKKKIIKLGLYYYFEIILHQKDIYKTNSYANFVIELLETDRGTAAWFLKNLISNKQLFMDYILSNPQSEVRDGFGRIINNCIISLYHEEEKYLTETFKSLILVQDDMKENLIVREEYRSCLMRFFKNNILDLFDHSRQYCTKFNQFHQIIFECFSTKLFETVELAFDQDFLTKIIYFIMNNQRGFETNFMTMGSKALEPKFPILIDVLALMIISSITPGILNVKQYSQYSIYQERNNFIKLSDNNREMLIQRDIMGFNILRKYNNDYTTKMLYHLGWGDIETSVKLINCIVLTLRENLRDISAMTNLIKNTNGLLDIDDNHKIDRIKAIFCLDDTSELDNDSIFNYLMSYRDENPLCVMICLKLLGDLIKKYTSVWTYVYQFISKLVWIYYLLKDVANDPIKKDNLLIEATTENYNFQELFNYVEELYISNLKIKSIVSSHNSNMTFNDNDVVINNYNNFQDLNTEFKYEYKDEMILDFNKEQQESEKKIYDDFGGNYNPPHGPF